MNEQEMFDRHPLVRGSLHASCEEGWIPLIDSCLSQLESFGRPVVINRIAEKMGVLQIGIATPDSLSAEDQRRWEDIVRATEEASMVTCELCGAAGRLRRSTTGAWATRCDLHEGN
ncbi:hypothetical protein [Rhizobium pisi]|uniref:hypothetical protein n=1 Tax=Rhizobium pisi TaxID=574561 RepID=UPI003CFE3A7F